MTATFLILAAAAAAQAAISPGAPAERTPVSVPAAAGLFERDWVLMNWALKTYDKDGDFKLSPAEATAAAGEFRRIADADNDGRVTTGEYRAARAFMLARN